MNRILRIGTRESKLALWQTRQVQEALAQEGMSCELVPITSEGDQRLTEPLYEMGISGIFTRTLDIALLEGQIDVAVHSLKDVPTQLPKGLQLVAVLPRGPIADILVMKSGDSKVCGESTAHIATGSLRRRAQWLHYFPTHTIEGLRGNVQTRLKKLASHPWDGAIFAEAGLARLNLLENLHWHRLDWMLPAPAQGIVGIVCRETDQDIIEQVSKINHPPTWFAAQVERSFMRKLEGGCSAPIGALLWNNGTSFQLQGRVLSLDGQQCIDQTWDIQDHSDPETEGNRCAEELLQMGAKEILDRIRLGKR